MSTGWYEERSEPERVYRGRLGPRTTGASPGGRTRLLFELDTGERVLAIYAPIHEPVLEGLAGRRVELVGKIVDLGDEGFSPELWLNPERAPR